MSKNEKDYSDYLGLMSNMLQVYALMAGFMFTAITLLVTLLPDPSHIIAQATLITLSVVFALCIFQIDSILNTQSYSIRVSPPLPKGFRKRSHFLDIVIWGMLGIPMILMFFLWNLAHLALAAIVVNALMWVLFYIHTIPLRKAMQRFRVETKKSWRIRKFFDERDIIYEGEE